jgi:hypothetical protein
MEMAKRAKVKSNNIQEKPRRARDWYATPEKAVEPLIAHLPEYGTFCEPCAGDGRLSVHIESLTCDALWPRQQYDIEPQADGIVKKDALTLVSEDLFDIDLLITNPPFEWETLQQMLELFPTLKPTWLLLPFGYACNKRMAPYMDICKKVVPIGRVKWIEDSKQSSTDDFAWFLFDASHVAYTRLYPRK